ncbi:unnamed protein product [Ambrosiozyma monospora]|uniref:Unnamed protein product n=1 Tax=Ambrosiozyma monospora TaxID=43982 RepID=A0ACB5SXN7_AMBMO|nr:unnamed protein product [Ambrosiozyma monospora]
MPQTLQELLLSNPTFKKSRLDSLFSNFDQLKDANPEGYEANIATWKTFLNDLILNHADLLESESPSSSSNGKFAFDSDKLVRKLTVRDGAVTYVPKGLDKVLDEMINVDHTLIPYSSFEKALKPGILSSIPLLSRVFGGIPSKVTVSNFASRAGPDCALVKDEKFIHFDKLVDVSKSLLSTLKVKSEGWPILEKHVLALFAEAKEGGEEGKEVNMTPLDFHCCLLYLSKIGKLIEYNENSGVLNVPDNEGSNKKVMDEESKTSIAQLNYSIYLLNEKCEKTSLKILEQSELARQSVKKQNLVEAKTRLRSKKLLENQLEKTHSSLNNLLSIQFKIQEANDNLVAVDILDSNAKVLQGLNRQVNAENVDGLVDGIASEVEKINEVTTQLGGLKINEDENDEELDEELQQMEMEELDKIESSEKMDKIENAKLPQKQAESSQESVGRESSPEDAFVDAEDSNDLSDDILERFKKLKTPTAISENKKPIAAKSESPKQAVAELN